MQFTNNIDALMKALDRAARDACDETAASIAEDARGNCPRDSGALAASIYVAHEDGTSTYGEATGQASALNPKTEFEPELKLDDASAEGVHQAAVEVAANYANIIHEGYGARAGRPFLEEAVNNGKGDFEKRLSEMIDRLPK